MYDDGYKNIVNVDVSLWAVPIHFWHIWTSTFGQYSSVVIEQMQKRHETDRPEMECRDILLNIIARTGLIESF